MCRGAWHAPSAAGTYPKSVSVVSRWSAQGASGRGPCRGGVASEAEKQGRRNTTDGRARAPASRAVRKGASVGIEGVEAEKKSGRATPAFGVYSPLPIAVYQRDAPLSACAAPVWFRGRALHLPSVSLHIKQSLEDTGATCYIGGNRDAPHIIVTTTASSVPYSPAHAQPGCAKRIRYLINQIPDTCVYRYIAPVGGFCPFGTPRLCRTDSTCITTSRLSMPAS